MVCTCDVDEDGGMKQMSFASLGAAGNKRQTRRERLLGGMRWVVHRVRLTALVEPHYPSSGKA
jgi:transposase, IS5 family